MTDLERRALLGDAEAQRQCTEKGIVLPCPWCGCDERDMIGLSVYHEQYFYSCEACGCNGPIVYDNDKCDYPEYEALSLWNTRPAPTIGRCGECAFHDTFDCPCGTNGYTNKIVGFCGFFETKERKENERA